jgi:hypothetical protein
MRNGPGTSYARVGGIYTGTSPDFVCWTQGQNVGGVDVWFLVHNAGATGYYASYYDDSHYATDAQITPKYGISRCGTPAPSPPAPVSPVPGPPPPPPSTPTWTVSVINVAGVDSQSLAHFETAAAQMINGDLHAAWGRPYIQFAPGSPIRLLLTPAVNSIVAFCGANAAGCHRSDGRGPWALANTNNGATGMNWQIPASHELEEMLVDPNPNQPVTIPVPGIPGAQWMVEVGDPVQPWYVLSRNGVQIADFVRPAWYTQSAGPVDDTGRLPASDPSKWPYTTCPHGSAVFLYGGKVERLTCNSLTYNAPDGGSPPRALRKLLRTGHGVPLSKFIPVIPRRPVHRQHRAH